MDTAMENNSTRSSSTFTSFPRLPAELRLAIWRFSLPVRILTLRTLPAPSPHPWGRPAFATLDPEPALLSVNREAREEALENYSVIKDPYGHGFYFNSYRDTLFFDVECPSWITILYDLKYSSLSSSSFSAVRSIALMNESMPAGIFAATILRCGILEVFLVGQYFNGMPDVWPLIPRLLENNGLAVDRYQDGDYHRKIIQRLFEARAVDRPAGCKLPLITAVNYDAWRQKGVNLRGAWL